ncbi:MAG: type II toxin-antitoxin system HicA family toxin [Acidobacteria bacterium]|nr:type II toxin-antitoxin system HicA family toxin [Acidobacteriota bacterium]
MSRLPTLQPRQLVAALKRAGFIEHHQTGSHLYLWHPSRKRMTSIPMHPGDLKRGTASAILKQAGLTEDELRDLL